jgi:Ca2+/H+ antiporter, TMEM165/GDT1 family
MHLSNVISILLATYWTVLVAELVGDKAIYTITSLASRYSAAEVYAGITVAFMGKMLFAVLFTQVLIRVPAHIAAAVSAAILFGTAAALWTKSPGFASSAPATRAVSLAGGTGVAFAAIFFSEWGDIGQLSTAALSAQYRMPLLIWMGATAALMTKGMLAITLGIPLRRYVPTRVLKVAAVGSCCVLGAIAIKTAFVG